MTWRKLIIIALCYLSTSTQASWAESITNQNEPATSFEAKNVEIYSDCIYMPKGKIMLVRLDEDICALKFIDFWSEKPGKFTSFWTKKGEEDDYALYEIHYIGDNGEDYLCASEKYKQDKLYRPTPRGIGRLEFSFGNRRIKCRCITLKWFGKGSVAFYNPPRYPEADYGIEFAPTIWEDISQVNLSEPHIKWYTYERKRQKQIIPIDQLWEEEGNKK